MIQKNSVVATLICTLMGLGPAINTAVAQNTNPLERAESKRPKLVVVHGWCPLGCEPDAPRLGLLSDLVLEAFRAVDIDPIYQTLEVEEAFAGLKRGTVDAYIGAFAEEVPFAILSESHLGATDFCFFSRKEDKWRYSGVSSLQGRIFSHTAGFTYNPELDEFLKNNSSYVVAQGGSDPMQRSLRMLLDGRIESVLEDQIMAYLDRFNKKGIINSGCLNAINKAWLAFSPVNQSRSLFFKRAFDRGFKIIHSNGIVQKIADRYDVGLDLWFHGKR